jgi:hypothetical protein
MRRPTVDVRVASRNHWGNDGFGFFFQRNWNSQPANTRPRANGGNGFFFQPNWNSQPAYARPRAGQYYEMQQRWW